jgi:tetraacyldisaccharide 4'-kinase
MSNRLSLLFFLGRPFSPLYGLAMKIRAKMYNAGVLRQEKLPVPVISVGNLVLGGTGKTPTVQHIARLLLQQGLKPAIVSRGYRGKAKQPVNVVSNGESILLSATLAGDEPFMLAESLPGVPVLTGRRRIFPCRHAIEQFEVDVIILDDGFQHLSIKRDIDVVLFDGTALAGNSRIFPGGPLREPVEALNRCQAFLVTGKTETNRQRIEHFSELLLDRFPDKPIYSSSISKTTLLKHDMSVCEGKTSDMYFGFCGIANPLRFKESLDGSGVHLASFLPLKDHTVYSQTLLLSICKKAIACGADNLVTTEKDFVKIKDLTFALPIFILKTQYQVDQAFDLFLAEHLKKGSAGQAG